MSDGNNTRDNEIKQIWKQFSGFYWLLGFILCAGLAALLFIDQITDFSMNAITEGLGVLFTIVVVDRLARQRAEQERKEELIFQMGSDEALHTKAAVRILRHKGWLKDGSLQGLTIFFTGNVALRDNHHIINLFL